MIPTREMVEAEPAGPRLNAWVAEYVMGWQWFDNGEGQEFFRPQDVFQYGAVARDNHNDIQYLKGLPAYSESWDAMRLVVERMRKDGYADYHEFLGGLSWWLFQKDDDETPDGNAEAETDPLACSRAALLAKIEG